MKIFYWMSVVVFLGLSQKVIAIDLKIGVAEALTGPAAQYGVAIKNGFQLAADEINAKGGVYGHPIVLIIEDERGKKEEAINVFKKLIFDDKVLMVFGPTLSNSAFAAHPIAQANKVVAFGTSNTATGITDKSPFIFRNSVMESDVLPVTMAAAKKLWSLKKVAIIYGNDDAFTKSGYHEFTKAIVGQQIAIVAIETYAKGDIDFKAQLTKIRATNPEAIVCSCLAEEAANIILQARGLGITVPFIGGNGLNSPKVFEIAKGAGENTLIGTPWSAENPSPINQAFIKAYKARYKAEPNQFAAQAYDALYIVVEALKKVNFDTKLHIARQELQKALPSIKWEGVTGPFEFRQAAPVDKQESGYDAKQKAVVQILRGGKYELLRSDDR